MSETLAGHIKVLSGWAFPSGGFNQIEGLPLIRIRDLGRDATEVKFKGAYDSAYLVDDGDVLIGMDGDFAVQKWTGGSALLNQRVCKVESASMHLDQGFLYWYLMPHVAEIHRKTPQTTVRHLSAASLSEILAPPIPIAEQRAVTQILDTLDTTLRQTEAIIDKLKQVKQGLLHDLLTRGIDANGELRPPQSQAPQLYKESVLGWIPREWEVRPAEDVCEAVIDCKNRTPPETTEGHAVVRTPNVRNGRFVRDGLAFTDPASFAIWTQRGKPRAGDILITREAPVGEVCLLPTEIADACLGQRMMMYRSAKDILSSEFMLVALLSKPVQKVLADLSGGSTVGHVRVGDIRTLAIPIPPIVEQSKIASSYFALERRLLAEEATLSKLSAQKSGLMDDLLTGRVRVTPLLDAHRPAAEP